MNARLLSGTLLLGLSLVSQGAAESIHGEISDSTGAKAPGVSVKLTEAASNAERSSTTGGDGAFRFDNLPAGQYRLSVEKSGFSTLSRALEVPADAKQPLSLVLEVGALRDVITVSAQRNAREEAVTPEAVSAVANERLDARMPLTATDVLRDMPGVYTQSQGFFTRPNIRGFEGNRVLVLVDGERLNNSRSPTGHIGTGMETGVVDPSMVESVEVVRGGGSVLYGTDAVGGTINFITSGMAPSPDRWRIGIDANPLVMSNGPGGRYAGSLSLLGPKLVMRVHQSFENFSDYKAGEPVEWGYLNSGRGYNPSTRLLTRSGYRSDATKAEARWYQGDRWTARGGYERYHADNLAYPLQTSSLLVFAEREKYRGGLTLRGHGGVFRQLQLNGYWQTFNRRDHSLAQTAKTYQVTDSLRTPKTTGFDAQLNLAAGPRHVITAGASYHRDHSEDQRFVVKGTTPAVAGGLTADDARAIQQRLQGGDEALADYYRKLSPDVQTPNATFQNAALFVQEEWYATRRLRLTGGLRLDHYRSRAFDTSGYDLFDYFPELPPEFGIRGIQSLRYVNTALTGSLSALFTVRQGFSLYARAGRSYREPNLHDRFTAGTGHALSSSSTSITVPNPELKPETGWNVDVGAKLKVSRARVNFGYFNNTFRDFITSSGKAIVGVPKVEGPYGPLTVLQRANIDRLRFQGVEAEVEVPFRIGSGFLTPFGNASTNKGDDLRAHVPVDPLYFPVIPFKSVLGARWTPSSGRYWWDYRARTVTTQDRLPAGNSYWAAGKARLGYTTHDIRVGYQVPLERVTLTINAGVENIGNRFYQELFSLYDVPARGRTFIAGLRFRFF